MKLIDVSTPKFPNTFAMVDDEDFERVTFEGKWGATKGKKDHTHYVRRYIRIKGKWVTQLLHRFILGAENPLLLIDHADRNGLNCQKSNLRFCNHPQNQGNQAKNIIKTSRYKGVYWDKSHKSWRSQIQRVSLGDFSSETDAAKAYDKAAIEVFGKFARLNFPSEAGKK